MHIGDILVLLNIKFKDVS